MLINSLIKENFDAIVIHNLVNIKYLSNFSGSNAVVIITKDKKFLLTDGRYKEQANNEVYKDFQIKIIDRSLNLTSFLKNEKINKIFLENDLRVDIYLSLKKEFEVKLLNNQVQKIRSIKNSDEINKIKKSIDLLNKSFDDAIANIKPGKTSENDVYHHMLNFGLKYGAEMAFCIVSVNENSAMPHARPTDKIINENDILLIDAGYYLNGYASDMTRTFFVKNNHSKELTKVYDIVLNANKKAINAIKPGIKANQIDKIARDYITKNGYGDQFVHGLGHSLGMDIHEAPYFNKSDESILEKGMIMTVEPGIYLENIGGVRIEDVILVTEDGCEVLTKDYPKELKKI